MELEKVSILFFLIIVLLSAAIYEYSFSPGDLALNISVNPEKITLNESYEIAVTLKNVGDKSVRVLPLLHQLTLELKAYNEKGEELPYSGMVTIFKPIKDLKILKPGESIETKIFCYPSTPCWNFTKPGRYKIKAIYSTSNYGGKRFLPPHWEGTISNITSIMVVSDS